MPMRIAKRRPLPLTSPLASCPRVSRPVVTHIRGLPSASGQLIIQGYRRHRLGASRNGLEEGGYLGIPLGAVRIGRGEGPQPFERGLESRGSWSGLRP
jgi:hypothetical protein